MLNCVYIVCVVFITNVASFVDPCTIDPAGSTPENDTQIFTVPPSCPDGTVQWTFPRGKVDLHVIQQSPFKLCLRGGAGGEALTIFDNSFGQHHELKTLSRDENQCIKSNGHTAMLEVVAPATLRYVAVFTFEIVY